MRTYRIAAIPADGVGQEVIPAGIQALEALASAEGTFRMEFETFPWGCAFYHQHGRMMPADALETLKAYDAIFFGAVGHPSVPDHISLWGLRLAICQGFDQYANIRPARILPGIASPLRGKTAGDLDWVIVRENSEGEYAGVGGRAHRGLPEEVGLEVSVFTRNGVARIMRVAFELAGKRPRRHLTLVTKSNAQRHGMVMWDEIFTETAQNFTEVTTDRMLVDAMTTRMVLKPESLDVIVATNLHADILSDLAAALSGSLGIGPHGQPEPGTPFPIAVRAHPRLRLRHHGPRDRQPCGNPLVGGAHARASGRREGRSPPDDGHRKNHRRRPMPDPRPGRHGYHPGGDRRRL